MKTFKEFLFEKRNVLNLNDFESNTRLFLQSWMFGTASAKQSLTKNIKEDLKQTIDLNKRYRLMRGMKFKSTDAFRDFFGVDVSQIKKGMKFKKKFESYTSWSSDPSEAKKFANPEYDSFTKIYLDKDDINDMGYDNDELLGIGVLIYCQFEYDDIVCDLNSIKNFSDEYEVIINPGTYEITVVDAKSHYFQYDNKTKEIDLNFDDEDLTQIVKKEGEFIDRLKTVYQEEFKNSSTEDLIKHLENNNETDQDAVIFLMLFSMNKDLVKWISDNSKIFSKRKFKFFSIREMLTLRNFISNFQK